ncbi:hypothetical protein ACLMJK_007031 [Lecanora helva]
MSTLQSIIRDISDAAQADAAGDPRAHVNLLQSIHRLTLAAERPTETVKRLIYQVGSTLRTKKEPPTNAALRYAVEVGLVDAISRRGGPVTAKALAKETGVEELLIVRVMRALTAMGVCTEWGLHEYCANNVTREVATPGLHAGVIDLFDTFIPAGAAFVDSVKQIGSRSPQHPNETPFSFAKGKPCFDWMKDNPEQRKYFDQYMSGRRKEVQGWYDIFPVSEKTYGLLSGPEAALLVDIGGSHGHDMIEFKKRHPRLPGRLVLQDLPETLQSLPDPLDNIEIMPYNFFDPQPVQGARFYYFGSICHDWADEYCIKLLTNTARAMKRDHSTLLIQDHVVPDVGASLRQASLDLQMMALLAGIERSESQWRDLLDACGLTISEVWRSENGLDSVIEARLKEESESPTKLNGESS